ncbi:MAG: hypothetical protein V7L11_11720 [Nostoc sp.]
MSINNCTELTLYCKSMENTSLLLKNLLIGYKSLFRADALKRSQ